MRRTGMALVAAAATSMFAGAAYGNGAVALVGSAPSLGGRDIARSAATASPIPTVERTRIVAEYGRALALLPSWLPPGYRLDSWSVESGSFGYLLDRLSLHFRKGTSDLVWEVASASSEETKDRADCRPGMGARHVVSGKGVNYTNDTAGVEAAWICTVVQSRFRAEVAASAWQVAGRRGATWKELLRVAASARPTHSAELVQASTLVPAADARRLRASFGAPLPLPTQLADGFVFTRAGIRKASAYGARTAYVVFGRDGRQLQWSVSPSGGKYDFKCPRSGSPSFQRTAVIGGKTVYLGEGTVGQSAWICLRGSRPRTVEMWNDYSVGGEALMRIVATSRG